MKLVGYRKWNTLFTLAVGLMLPVVGLAADTPQERAEAIVARLIATDKNDVLQGESCYRELVGFDFANDHIPGYDNLDVVFPDVVGNTVQYCGPEQINDRLISALKACVQRTNCTTGDRPAHTSAAEAVWQCEERDKDQAKNCLNALGMIADKVNRQRRDVAQLRKTLLDMGHDDAAHAMNGSHVRGIWDRFSLMLPESMRDFLDDNFDAAELGDSSKDPWGNVVRDLNEFERDVIMDTKLPLELRQQAIANLMADLDAVDSPDDYRRRVDLGENFDLDGFLTHERTSALFYTDGMAPLLASLSTPVTKSVSGVNPENTERDSLDAVYVPEHEINVIKKQLLDLVVAYIHTLDKYVGGDGTDQDFGTLADLDPRSNAGIEALPLAEEAFAKLAELAMQHAHRGIDPDAMVSAQTRRLVVDAMMQAALPGTDGHLVETTVQRKGLLVDFIETLATRVDGAELPGQFNNITALFRSFQSAYRNAVASRMATLVTPNLEAKAHVNRVLNRLGMEMATLSDLANRKGDSSEAYNAYQAQKQLVVALLSGGRHSKTIVDDISKSLAVAVEEFLNP